MADAQHITHIGSWDWEIANDKISWSDELYRIYGLRPRECSSGLYLRLPQLVWPGARLFLIVEFSPAATVETFALRFAIRGVVVRTEWMPDGMCGVAVAITNNRQL